MRGTAWFSVTRSLAAAAVFACTLQAMHWPLLMKPGTPLMWWQVSWMAHTGEVLGSAPVLLTTATSFAVSGVALESLCWFYAASWAVGLYWVVGRLVEVTQREPVPAAVKRLALVCLSLFLSSFTFGAFHALQRWTGASEYLSRPGTWFSSLFFTESAPNGFVTPQFLFLAVAFNYLLYTSAWCILASALFNVRMARTRQRA